MLVWILSVEAAHVVSSVFCLMCDMTIHTRVKVSLSFLSFLPVQKKPAIVSQRNVGFTNIPSRSLVDVSFANLFIVRYSTGRCSRFSKHLSIVCCTWNTRISNFRSMWLWLWCGCDYVTLWQNESRKTKNKCDNRTNHQIRCTDIFLLGSPFNLTTSHTPENEQREKWYDAKLTFPSMDHHPLLHRYCIFCRWRKWRLS